jgi:tRNA threonylcarbamoyladenosine biosynthesis protein TsaB
MALILCIETATEVCSVALSGNGNILKYKESAARNVHSSMLTLFIDEIIKSSDHTMGELDAIAVSMGPGSYTGLRIGVATAKGLCYALGKPLIAIPTLRSMAEGMKYKLQMTSDKSSEPLNPLESKIVNLKSKILFCPLIDARRMEVYSELFDEAGNTIREVRAEIIDAWSFQEYLADHTIVFGGEGSEKCKPDLAGHPHALFMDEFMASAIYLAGLANEKFGQQQFENLAYFEPFYLKDFVAGKPRVKGLD